MESGRHSAGWRCCPGASMGPPPFGDGKLQQEAGSERANLASMGPPPFGDGKGHYFASCSSTYASFNGATAFRRWKASANPILLRSAYALQWGHRLSAMESWPKPDGGWLQDRLLLQWGHRLSAMESPLFLPSDRFGYGFNGATAFRRWKERLTVASSQGTHRLASMGPPPFGDGKRVDVLIYNVVEGASMGPPPFGDGKFADKPAGLSV